MNIGLNLEPLEKPLTQFAEAKKAEIEMQKPLIEGLAKSFDHFGDAIDKLIAFGLAQEERRAKRTAATEEVDALEAEIKKAELNARLAAINAAGEKSLEDVAKARAEANLIEAQNELRAQKLKQKKLENQEEEEAKRHEVKMSRLADGKVSDYDL